MNKNLNKFYLNYKYLKKIYKLNMNKAILNIQNSFI